MSGISINMKAMEIYKKLTFLLVFVFLFGCESADLQKNGIPVTGVVLKKKMVITNRDYLYKMKVGFYVKPEIAGNKKEEIVASTDSAKYLTTELYLSSSEYGQFQTGDSVELVYDKSDPEQVEIREGIAR